MSKKANFRGCFDEQYGKCAQTLLKSSSQHLYHIHWSLATKLYLKKSLLLTCQILRLLVNTLAADGNYLVLNRDNLTIPVQMQFSPKQKAFSQCFAAFLKITLNFKHFEWKYDSHRFCVFEIMDSENVVRWMTKKSHFREPFDKQHGKGAQALFKSESHHLYNIHWSLLRQLSCKKSLLLTCQILGLLVNTMAADGNYLVLNRDNLTIPIQMQWFQKKKAFSQHSAAFLKSRLNFKHFY